MFSLEDAHLLIAWAIFVGVQLGRVNLKYYTENRHKLAIFKFSVWAYVIIHAIVFPSLVLSMYFFSHWIINTTQWQYLSVYVLYIIMIILDKIWFQAFFHWKNVNLSLVLSIFITTLSILIAVVMRFVHFKNDAVWWLPFTLMIPFILLYGHTIVLCLDWKAHVH